MTDDNEPSKVRDVSDQFGDNPYADDVEYSEMATSEFRLDPRQVEATFTDCLFDTDAEAKASGANGIKVEGIVFDAMLNREKLAEHRTLITQMLMELPEQFRKSGGGGWSFLQACDDRHGNQWTGLHQTMSMLFLLGEGIGMVKASLPRDMWGVLPGGMPYYVIEA